MMSQLQYPILLLNLFIEMFVYITVDEVVPVLLLEFENYLVKTVHKPLSSLFTAGLLFPFEGLETQHRYRYRCIKRCHEYYA
ncbi:hypothetical protein EB796_000980 [Bugula neritina]|uniref:Uncharacterized protein n=1 Tax=Bugula neritina TaxID=10212 RepID=A0A7J7KRK3_BUGNE|nr:hypothetical protein EB796_000980 [Bugula neritina]